MMLKKIISFTLSLLIVGSTFLSFNPKNNTVFAEKDENIYLQEESLIPYKYNSNDEFTYESIIVVIKRTYGSLNKEWSPEDFTVNNVKRIEDLTFMEMSLERQSEYLENVDFHQILRVYLQEQSFDSVMAAISEFEECDSILTVGPNYTFKECSTVPNDPYIPSGYFAFSNTDLYDAWDIETGSSDVKVGVIDSGIANVPDLAGNIDYSLGYDFYNNDNWTSDDSTGHGTKVASMVGAIGNNSTGVCGVCWDVTLVPLQVQGGGVAEWIEAVSYAIFNDIPILNLSYSINGSQPYLEYVIRNYEGLFVCSAGNDGYNIDESTPLYPSCLPNDNIISVAASTYNDNLRYSSNYGATSVDLAAPGEGVWVANTSGTYDTVNGTSYAAPMVAGTAALLLSYNPNLTSLEIKEAILNSVDYVSSYSGKILTSGRLNVKKALQYVKTPNQVQNIVIQVNKPTSSSISSFSFDVLYHRHYQQFAGFVNGTIIPSGYSVAYSQNIYLTDKWNMHFYYSGSNISNSGELFTCRYNTNINEPKNKFEDSITISNPNNLQYTIAVLGDLDNNGIINQTDKTMLQDYLLNSITLNSQQLLAADANCDGSVDMGDVISIIYYINKLIDSFY